MDQKIYNALKESKIIAVVGLSEREERPSWQVGSYLLEAGYTIIPVNPNIDSWLGMDCFPDLKSVPGKIDLIDVFRRKEALLPLALDAIKKKPKYFWMQEGVWNDEAKEILEKEGITVIMDRCMKVEHSRLRKNL